MQVLMTITWIVVWFLLAIGFFWFGFGVGYRYHRERMLKSIANAKEIITKDTEERMKSFAPGKQDVPDYTQVIDGIRYKTMDAKCIAQGGGLGYWSWLMQTNKDSFFFVSKNFLVDTTFIVPTDKDFAKHVFSNSQHREVQFEDAFPGSDIKDA